MHSEDTLHVLKDYFAGEQSMSSNRQRKIPHVPHLLLLTFFLVATPPPGLAQYPGKISEAQKATPILRSVAVLEWTGDPGKPKSSRLIPITVFDQGDYQDGGLYMARPAPLAVLSDTLYELQVSGVPKGYFDVTSAGKLDDTWFGYGAWRPLRAPAPPKNTQSRLTPEVVVDVDDDKPHLKRHPGSEAPEDAGKPGTSTSASSSSSQKASTQDQKSSQTSTQSAPDDPDRPHLRKRSQPAETNTNAEAGVEAMAPGSGDDPDRPKLHRGQPPPETTVVADKLTGIPEGLQQMVAVSDASDRPEHSFIYSWANKDEETTARTALEQLAMQALTPKATPHPKVSPTTRRRTTVATPPPPPKPQFEEEQFRTFELAYGSGATMVFFGRTEGEGSAQRFVTLIAQTDLYGTPQILLKKTTDGAHLDDTPQMRFIDAVDANGGNRGQLLFEMRGETKRQFVLYNVTRGQAEQVFATANLP
jgi:hypothetical protein